MYLEDRGVVDVERWLVGAEHAKVAIDGHSDPADDWNAGQDVGHQNLTGPRRDPRPRLIRRLRWQRQVCTELKISRRTFDRWRALGTGPKATRLGGTGPVRVRRSWLDQWVDAPDQDIA